jgi:uroporphyrinogen decarboxylase
MTSRERVYRALTFQCPDRAPRELWTLPGITMFRKAELDAVLARFPSDFTAPEVRYGVSKRARGTEALVGTYVDAWGCPFTVAEPGVIGEVKDPPLADLTALHRFRPPDEILDEADFSRVNASCAATDKFVKAGTTIRPFERMQFLRGTENLMMDLAWGIREVYQLRDMVHDFFLRELSLWLKTDVDGISFMDDWGSQERLLISPSLWREFFKPLYADYCQLIHSAGKFAFFHSDGYIMEIIPDLIEIGVDALNSQLFCMSIEEIGRRFRGQITFWGEIDRQKVLPFGTVENVRKAVWRVRRALDDGRGGVIAECEWGIGVPRENIEAVFQAWLEPADSNPDRLINSNSRLLDDFALTKI